MDNRKTRKNSFRTADGEFCHILKCWPRYFEMIWSGVRLSEIRRGDRPYRAGDYMEIGEYCPLTHTFTGRAVSVLIREVIPEKVPGLHYGYCLILFEPPVRYVECGYLPEPK